MTCWRRYLRTSPRVVAVFGALAVALGSFSSAPASAQARENVLSQREVEALRESAFVPTDRLLTFERILDDREHELETLLTKRRGHTDFAGETHDLLEQFGQIADELNDNLDEYAKAHRDVRKALPKLLNATERWSTALRSPADDEAYAVVRRIALDNVADTRDLTEKLRTELDVYFKAHPDAEKAEKARSADPHAVQGSPE